MTTHNKNTISANLTNAHPKAQIYTRTGDKGTTRLVDGSCVEKFNPRVEAYGCVDELNSVIGMLRSELRDYSKLQDLNSPLEQIQNKLFNLGSLLACEKESILKTLPQITENNVIFLELEIDRLTSELPELRQFILPGGHKIAATLHIARTACRRAERRSSEITTNNANYDLSLQYLNRLSDYLFVASRWVNLVMQEAEITWKKDS